MTKLLLLLFSAAALCLVVTAGEPMVLRGGVFCDTCQVGYQTAVSHPVSGAYVKVECTSGKDMSEVSFTQHAVTDFNGNYRMEVDGDFPYHVCDAILVNSTTLGCNAVSPERARSRVILTRNNGMASLLRYANALGFRSDVQLASCAQVLAQYQETETDD